MSQGSGPVAQAAERWHGHLLCVTVRVAALKTASCPGSSGKTVQCH